MARSLNRGGCRGLYYGQWVSVATDECFSVAGHVSGRVAHRRSQLAAVAVCRSLLTPLRPQRWSNGGSDSDSVADSPSRRRPSLLRLYPILPIAAIELRVRVGQSASLRRYDVRRQRAVRTAAIALLTLSTTTQPTSPCGATNATISTATTTTATTTTTTTTATVLVAGES